MAAMREFLFDRVAPERMGSIHDRNVAELNNVHKKPLVARGISKESGANL
jgi:hypothetical protein